MMRLLRWSCIMMKLTSKKSWGKRKEQVFRRGSWLIHHLQNMSYQKIYIFWYYVVSDEAPSTSSQIIQPIELIQEVSKLNEQEPDKKQGHQTRFFPKKTLQKSKWILYCLLYLLSHLLIGRVIKWSIHQIYKKVFHLSRNSLSCNEVKRLELKQDLKKNNEYK